MPVSIFPALPQITEISTGPCRRSAPSRPSVWLLTGGAANALVCRKSGGKFGRSDGRLVACTEEAGRASRGHTCTHAHSRQTCSLLPSSLPCSLTPSLPCPRFQFRSFPRTQELLNSALYFRAKTGTELFFVFPSVACCASASADALQASKARRRRKIVPDPRGDFYAIARQSGLKLTAVSLSLCERLRCQLHLLRLLQPNSSRTVSKGVSEFKARLIACFAVPENNCSGNKELTKIKDDTLYYHGQDSECHSPENIMLHAQQQYQKPQAIIPRLLLPSESEASNYWFSLLSLSVAPDAANLFLLCDVFSCTNRRCNVGRRYRRS